MTRALHLLLSMFMLAIAVPAGAAETSIPQFWDAKERLTRPDIAFLPRVRFLTTVDFPPFNYVDANGLITGFHVDLARAICRKLEMHDYHWESIK